MKSVTSLLRYPATLLVSLLFITIFASFSGVFSDWPLIGDFTICERLDEQYEYLQAVVDDCSSEVA